MGVETGAAIDTHEVGNDSSEAMTNVGLEVALSGESVLELLLVKGGKLKGVKFKKASTFPAELTAFAADPVEGRPHSDLFFGSPEGQFKGA